MTKGSFDQGADFFKSGRIACSITCTRGTEEHVGNPSEEEKEVEKGEALVVLFGGCGIEKEFNDVIVVPESDFLEEGNFSEITEIM